MLFKILGDLISPNVLFVENENDLKNERGFEFWMIHMIHLIHNIHHHIHHHIHHVYKQIIIMN